MSFSQQVQPKAGTPGVSTDSSPPAGSQAAPAGGSNMLAVLLPLLILVPFLFMSFRRQKKEQEQRAKLKKGDRVVTQSGLIGELAEADERIAKVKIAPGTTVQVLASTLAPFDTASASAGKGAKVDKGADKSDKSVADVMKEAKAAADKK
ncbi:MAG: preprotein translocase subunit YajC [Polyangiaceae bacterium]|nr:preprotein translocase subunit YajC [Polyangiaceae bacterium]